MLGKGAQLNRNPCSLIPTPVGGVAKEEEEEEDGMSRRWWEEVVAAAAPPIGDFPDDPPPPPGDEPGPWRNETKIVIHVFEKSSFLEKMNTNIDDS